MTQVQEVLRVQFEYDTRPAQKVLVYFLRIYDGSSTGDLGGSGCGFSYLLCKCTPRAGNFGGSGGASVKDF